MLWCKDELHNMLLTLLVNVCPCVSSTDYVFVEDYKSCPSLKSILRMVVTIII